MSSTTAPVASLPSQGRGWGSGAHRATVLLSINHLPRSRFFCSSVPTVPDEVDGAAGGAASAAARASPRGGWRRRRAGRNPGAGVRRRGCAGRAGFRWCAPARCAAAAPAPWYAAACPAPARGPARWYARGVAAGGRGWPRARRRAISSHGMSTRRTATSTMKRNASSARKNGHRSRSVREPEAQRAEDILRRGTESAAGVLGDLLHQRLVRLQGLVFRRVGDDQRGELHGLGRVVLGAPPRRWRRCPRCGHRRRPR